MTFTPTLLIKKTPRLFDRSELVIQVDDSVIIHPLAIHLVQQYAREGYQIAVNEFQFVPRYLALLDSIDYIKLNFQTMSEGTLRNVIEIAHSMNKKCIAMAVETAALYDSAIAMGVDALEGSYVAERLENRAHTSGYLQGNFFRLMVAVTKEVPELDEIVELISVDATLTYALLRIVNSGYFALRHRATTVHQAIMTLGLSQLKQWIYLLSASNAENEFDAGAEEFLKLSFLRASFCNELMAYAKNMPISKADAYLMGMFSTLHHLIDAPLADILAEVPVVDEVKQALLEKTGRAGALYRLAISYERADWESIGTLAEELQIPANLLTSLYFNCVEEVNGIWKQLTTPTPELSQAVEEDGAIPPLKG
jgi:EAL and modified HD-GYP domain-containing signal transduction protein